MSQVFDSLSPFTAVRCEDDYVRVEFSGVWYGLESINNVPCQSMLKFCKAVYSEAWEEKLATGPVEVMTRMGHRPADTLTILSGTPANLELRNLQSGAIEEFGVAEMTRENYLKIDRAYRQQRRDRVSRQKRHDPEGYRRSPFTSVSFTHDGIRVEFRGREFQLAEIDGLSAASVVAFCRERYEAGAEHTFAGLLGAVLADMGRKPGDVVSLKLFDQTTGEVVAVDDAPMSQENQERLMAARSEADAVARRAARPDLPPKELMRRMLDEFEDAVERRWAYRHARQADYPSAFAAVRAKVEEGLSLEKFSVEILKIVALGIDGHSLVQHKLTPGGSLPFCIDKTGDRYVAFRPDRSGFVEPRHPYVERIDGRVMADWCAAAAALIPKGSPSFLQMRMFSEPGILLNVQYLRGQLNLPQHPDVTVEVVSEDRHSRKTLSFPVAKQIPLEKCDVWPTTKTIRPNGSRLLDETLGFLRLERMNREGVREIKEWMPRFRDTGGLIVDVRGNTGGDHACLRHFASYLMGPNDPPRVVKVIKYLKGAERGGEMDQNYQLEGYRGWTDGERAAGARFKTRFRPEWDPPSDRFGDWYYMILSRSDDPDIYRYPGRVVILMDHRCFSATDTFLSALKRWEGVTLMGTTSAGSSSGVALIRLCESMRLGLASRAGFQADGSLFDGKGVVPDVAVEPGPGFFIGVSDSALDSAVRFLTQRGDRSP